MDKSGSAALTHRAWIEGGILYNEFVNEVTLTAILEVQKKSLTLLSESRMHVAPLIVILIDIGRPQFKLHMADYGKILSAFDMIKHISSAWVIGSTEDVKKLVGEANKIYFSNSLRVVDTLQQAQEAARKLLSSTESILEKE